MSARVSHRAAWVVGAVLVALGIAFFRNLGEDAALPILPAIVVALFAFGFCVARWWTLAPLAVLCAYLVVRSALAPAAPDCDDLCEGGGYALLALVVAVLEAVLACGILAGRALRRRREGPPARVRR